MRKLLLVCGLFFSINSFAQSITDSAARDRITLKNMENIFYCGIGEAPMILSKEDRYFEKQFKTGYLIIGCLLPFSRETMIDHNKAVAELLDKKYGTAWRKKLRTDVAGVSKRTCRSLQDILRCGFY